jgi:hypothetical protein
VKEKAGQELSKEELPGGGNRDWNTFMHREEVVVLHCAILLAQR